MTNVKDNRRLRIKHSIRKKLSGTTQRPRLTVYRSNKCIYVQIIDDAKSRTLVSASSLEINNTKSFNIETSKAVGKLIAEKAQANGVSSVVFDRNGYLYHGNVKALADAAREAGLNF